jgi:hypothetical protein
MHNHIISLRIVETQRLQVSIKTANLASPLPVGLILCVRDVGGRGELDSAVGPEIAHQQGFWNLTFNESLKIKFSNGQLKI